MPLKLLCLRARQCPECDRQQQAWDHVKREAPGSVEIREIEMDGEPDAVKVYKVGDHPTTLLLKDGREWKRWIGITNKEEILQAIAEGSEKERFGKPAQVASGPATPGGPRLPPAALPPGGHVPAPGTEPQPIQPGSPPPGGPAP